MEQFFFVLGSNVLPACLPKSRVNAGATCYASGWGWTMPRKPEGLPSGYLAELQAVKLTVLSYDQCETINNAYKYNVSRDDGLIERGKSTFLRNYEICVLGGDKGTCQGDSGGPLVCEGNFLFCSLEQSRSPFVHYGNTGCGVFKGGKQN